MGRNVNGPVKQAQVLGTETNLQSIQNKTDKPDDYLARVQKYVPGEVVAFFVFVNSLLSEVAKPALDSKASSAEIGVALEKITMANGSVSVMTMANLTVCIGAVMTVVYLIVMREPDKKNEYVGLTACVSFVGFFFWAYALDAVAFRPWHDGILASVLLASFTLVSGAIAPAAQDAVSAWWTRLRQKPQAPVEEEIAQ